MQTMTDKELLELAAKAAGIKDEMWLWDWWNPLTDDGDALRLAVKLKFDFEWVDIDTICVGGSCCTNEDHYAAHRIAIVRAAAEIGKAGA